MGGLKMLQNGYKKLRNKKKGLSPFVVVTRLENPSGTRIHDRRQSGLGTPYLIPRKRALCGFRFCLVSLSAYPLIRG